MRHRDEGGQGERKMKARITRARVMAERMIREKMISIMAWGCTILVLLISIGSLVPKAAAQSNKYPKMAPVDRDLPRPYSFGLQARGIPLLVLVANPFRVA